MGRQLPETGDVVRVWTGWYWHYAIFVGMLGGVAPGVVELAKPREGGRVRRVAWTQFLGGRSFAVVTPPDAMPGHCVARRALAAIGRRGYDLLFWNCETFATECATGRGRSDQVRGIASLALVTACVGLAALADRRPAR
ncbi:MAG: lecithin retinol acyltransferase family protein [Planctomycetota bacterium]